VKLAISRNLYPIFAMSVILEPTLKMQRICALTVTPDNTREIGQVSARIAPQASTPSLKFKLLALYGKYLVTTKA